MCEVLLDYLHSHLHPHKDHGVILVPGGVKEAGIHVRANQRQKQQDMQKR